MQDDVVLKWKKGKEKHAIVRGQNRTFHHFTSVGRVGKKIETLTAIEGARIILGVLNDSECEADPALEYELCQCLSLIAEREIPLDSGMRAHRALTLEEEAERDYFNLISLHKTVQ